jgi:hypothetical protein
LRIRVLAAVHLDDEFLFAANEITEIGTDRHLTHKFIAVDLSGA